MNQKQGHEYRNELLISVPELSQQKEHCASVRLHGRPKVKGQQFKAVFLNLKNRHFYPLEEAYLLSTIRENNWAVYFKSFKEKISIDSLILLSNIQPFDP